MTWEQMALRLGIALLLGSAIGLERQWRSHYVGLRTNTLVTIGSAAMMIFGQMLPAEEHASLEHIASQIITGVGFLCAGVIMHEGVNIRGFNTAATLWCSVAVGIFTGTGLFVPAAILTVFIVLVNLLMLPIVYFVNRTSTPEEMSSTGSRRDQ